MRVQPEPRSYSNRIEIASELFVYAMGTSPVMCAPEPGAAMSTHGRTPDTTWTCAVSTTAPNAICSVPFAGGGLAVNVTAGPAEAFSVPTPPPTVQLKLTPGTGLLYTSNAWPENGCVSNGRRVTLFGETATRVTGPGETTMAPLSPVADAN